jgi:hypothetical protein
VHLKTDEYQCLMSKCIDKAIVDMAGEPDPAVTWEWIKFQHASLTSSVIIIRRCLLHIVYLSV